MRSVSEFLLKIRAELVIFTNAGDMSKSLVKKLMRMNLFSFGKGNEFRSNTYMFIRPT